MHQNQREFCCFVFFAPLDLNSPLLPSFNKPTLGTIVVQVKLKAWTSRAKRSWASATRPKKRETRKTGTTAWLATEEERG